MIQPQHCALVAAGLLVPSAVVSKEVAVGQAEYQLHCMACHQIDIRSVGPSLVAMAAVYPETGRAAFVEWAQKPGKKDPGMIQMPAMAHVPVEGLEKIHRYVLAVTEGKTEKKGAHQFPPFERPERELPAVVRGFLPDSSPASVAVLLEGKIGVCWDTEACRFRYAWQGDPPPIGTWRSMTELPAEPFYRETADRFWRDGLEGDPEFRGYRLIGGYPEFHYAIGPVEIRELVATGSRGGEIVRRFTLSGVRGPVRLDLAHEGPAATGTGAGSRDGDLPTPDADGTLSFTLSISVP